MAYYENYLYHHGILGMHWGVRRYQNPDGSLTAAGKARYYNSDGSLTKYGEREEKKKDHRAALTEYYKAQGYSKSEAEEQAIKHEKLLKGLKIAGVAALAVGTAYVAYRLGDRNLDRVIKAGKTIQTVHTGDIASRISNPFYATFTKADNAIYSSRMFGHFSASSKISELVANKDIKIASEKAQRKVFETLMKTDSEFSNLVKSLPTDRIRPKQFDSFSYHLVKRNPISSDSSIQNLTKQIDKYYDVLKSKGYGGLIDIEDSRLEGWTHSPSIIFENQIKNIAKTAAPSADDLSTSSTKFAYAQLSSSLRSTLLNPPKAELATYGSLYLATLGILQGTSTYADKKYSKTKENKS